MCCSKAPAHAGVRSLPVEGALFPFVGETHRENGQEHHAGEEAGHADVGEGHRPGDEEGDFEIEQDEEDGHE
eukprot:27880-Eustigmatos_ZCMA.PRE.1